ncbi:NifB/NifX family molybdenum-iron cluster-binding protein [Shewanella algae]
MIVIPMSRGRLAGHFTKAKELAFYDNEHNHCFTLDNPAAAGGNCAAKKAMLQLIKDKGGRIVLVDQIGERMLGKLLDGGISVCRPGKESRDIAALLVAASDIQLRLTSAAAGRPSLKHQAKGGCGGGCGCHGHDHDSAAGCGSKGCGGHNQAKSSLKPDSTSQQKLSYGGFRPL